MKRFLLFLPAFILLSFSGMAQQPENPFAADIRSFKAADSLNPPPQNAILFYGSSSFRMWNDVQDYFPGYTIINRGFGGSRLTDLILFAPDIVFPYNPKQIVIYCGENDFASEPDLAPGAVADRFKQLFLQLRAHFPEVKITYVSMKPSVSRWNMKDKFIEANGEIRKFLRQQPNTSFVNIWNKMLGRDRRPDATIFLDDRLHMNASGYKIWQKAIKPHLLK